MLFSKQNAVRNTETMQFPIEQLLAAYNDQAPLSQAATIPASWYTDPRIAELERANVFSKTWQLVARTERRSASAEHECGDDVFCGHAGSNGRCETRAIGGAAGDAEPRKFLRRGTLTNHEQLATKPRRHEVS